MNALAHRLLYTLCQALAPQEREVLLGDIEELDLSSREAIASVTGLILRRQAQPWKHWRPWAILLGLILPVILFLTRTAGAMADVDSVFLWMYAGNWTPDFLSRGWLLYALIPQAIGVLYFWLVMGCWSWTAGCVIAAVSRVPRWVNATLVALVLVLVAANKFRTGSASITATFLARQGRPWTPHWFYDVAFPIALLMLLVLQPAMVGMRSQANNFSQRTQRLLYAAIAISAFSALGAPIVAWLLRSVPSQFGMFRLIGLTPLAFAAPITYWIARKISRTHTSSDRRITPNEA